MISWMGMNWTISWTGMNWMISWTGMNWMISWAGGETLPMASHVRQRGNNSASSSHCSQRVSHQRILLSSFVWYCTLLTILHFLWLSLPWWATFILTKWGTNACWPSLTFSFFSPTVLITKKMLDWPLFNEIDTTSFHFLFSKNLNIIQS